MKNISVELKEYISLLEKYQKQPTIEVHLNGVSCKSCGAFTCDLWEDDEGKIDWDKVKHYESCFTQQLKFAKTKVKQYLKPLDLITSEERLEYFRSVSEGYCRECGRSDPNGTCQCWNDE